MQLSMLPMALLALLPLASAGYSYGGGSGSGPSSAGGAAAGAEAQTTETGATIIKVGETPLQMTPNSVTVPQGQIIEFHFYTGNHSVAQSAFNTPCQPLVNGTTVGFFSGRQPVAANAKGANVFRVTSTGQPMWFYCATGNHCQQGMVGVINPPPNNAQRTVITYAGLARAATSNVEPAAVGGGEVATATGAGAPGSTNPPGSAGVGLFGQLSMPVLGFAAAVAAVGGLVL